MQKKVRYTTILTIVSLVASIGVSSVFMLTRDIIKERELALRAKALYVVLPGMEGKPEEIIPANASGSDVSVFKGSDKDGQLIGYAACGEAQGYSSKIKVMVGVDPKLENVLGIDILSQNETPGLGTKMIEVESTSTLWSVISGLIRKPQKSSSESWEISSNEVKEVLRPWFQEQFKQKTYNQLVVSKIKDTEKITAITGATISTKAAVDAVKNAIDKIANSSLPQNWKIE